ncbi:MAG: hypothetical protein ACK5X0_22685 [Rhodospirillales bacterium]
MADDLFLYFDGVSAFGHINGAIQIEMSASVLDATEDGGVKVRRVTTGHLRCSPSAAADLAQAIGKALEMLQSKTDPAPASSTIN